METQGWAFFFVHERVRWPFSRTSKFIRDLDSVVFSAGRCSLIIWRMCGFKAEPI